MAVNIWEGAKVDALIEAISNGQKVDKQQGAINAGRVLAIGSDGLVIPAYSIMPDNVKTALIDCFEHVYWDTADGEKYGKALKDALFSMSVDSRVIYELPYGTDMSAFTVDTGVPARNDMDNEDFTILIKGTWEPTTEASFLLDASAKSRLDGSVFTGLRIATTVSNDQIMTRTTFKNLGGNSTPFNMDVAHDIVIVVRNFSRHLLIHSYVDDDLVYSLEDIITNTADVVGNYKIGIVESGIVRPWSGTIDFYKIYKVALSNQEINELVGTNITV